MAPISTSTTENSEIVRTPLSVRSSEAEVFQSTIQPQAVKASRGRKRKGDRAIVKTSNSARADDPTDHVPSNHTHNHQNPTGAKRPVIVQNDAVDPLQNGRSSLEVGGSNGVTSPHHHPTNHLDGGDNHSDVARWRKTHATQSHWDGNVRTFSFINNT